MYTIGIDEAGRGALAGPVVVAAVAIPRGIYLKRRDLPRLEDSKKLSRNHREQWFDFIRSNPDILYASARAYQKQIDDRNISNAANLAASRALARLLNDSLVKKYSVLIDGGLYLAHKDHWDIGARTIIRGDEKFSSIKLASIVAKVTRDSYMRRLDSRLPEYEFAKHKGYGTKLHMRLVRKYGPSEYHRLTFVRN